MLRNDENAEVEVIRVITIGILALTDNTPKEYVCAGAITAVVNMTLGRSLTLHEPAIKLIVARFFADLGALKTPPTMPHAPQPARIM